MTEKQPALPFDPDAFAAALSEMGRRCFEELHAFVLHAWEALRPLAEYLDAHPELAGLEPEPNVLGCHHLCGRTPGHGCTVEATTTLTMDSGHAIPMCQPCWEAALDARAVATITSARRALEAAMP